jgi:phage gpG-like protein
MGTRFTLTFDGDTQVDRTLARIQHQVEDARPVWADIASRFVRLEQRQFASHGAAASGGWAPLSPAYAAQKAKRYPGQPILVATGALRDSLTRRPLGIEVLEAKAMTIGSGVDHGKYHQNGTDRMPQRRPVEVTETTRRDWVKLIQKYILTGGGS